MDAKHADVKAGLTVAISIALLFVLVFLVGDWGLGLRSSRTVQVIFKHVIGLQPNSPVTYVGVEIGRVRDIEIIEIDAAVLLRLPAFDGDDIRDLPISSLEERMRLRGLNDDAKVDHDARQAIQGRRVVRVTLEVRQGAGTDEIRIDDLVRVDSNFMGETTVVISPGSGAKLPGNGILLGRSGNLFTDITDSVGEIRDMFTKITASLGKEQLEQIKEAIEHLRETAGDVKSIAEQVRGAVEENRPDLREAISGFKTSMEELRLALRDLRPRANALLESGKGVADKGALVAYDVHKILDANRKTITSLLAKLDEDAALASSAIRRADTLLATLDETVEENRSDLRRTVHDMRWTSRHFKDATDRLRRQPWLLLKRPRKIDEKDTDLYFAARRVAEASEHLDVAMERFEKLLADPGVAERLDAEAVKALLEDVRATFRETAGERDKVEKEVLEELPERARNDLLRSKREKDVREKE